MKSKSFCEDLTEGKFSFPIIHCIRKDPNDTRLISILKQRTDDVDVKRYAQRLMKESGSLSYTREYCRKLKSDIVNGINNFGGNPPLLKLIEVLDVQLEKMDTADAGVDSGGSNVPTTPGSPAASSAVKRGLDINEL